MLTARITSGMFVAAALHASAHADPRVEIGGYAGRTSSTIHQTFDCPRTSDPSEVCVSEAWPHEGAHGVSLGAYIRLPIIQAVQVEANGFRKSSLNRISSFGRLSVSVMRPSPTWLFPVHA